MLKIRLKRVGRKHDPSYRIIVTDSRKGPKSGNYIESVGTYDPRKNDAAEVKSERASYWLEQGAQLSDTVHNIFVDKGIIKDKKRNALPKKRPIVKEVKEEEKSVHKEPESETPPNSESADSVDVDKA